LPISKTPKGGWQFIKHKKNVGVTIRDFTIDLDKHNEKDEAAHSQWAIKGAWCDEWKGESNCGRIAAFVTPLLW
jgi:hypothetical protein